LKEALLHHSTNLSNLSRALRAYVDVRKPAALEMQDASRTFGLVLSGHKELLKTIEPTIARVSLGDPYEEIAMAKKMLEDTLFD
jgi:hypothetical protein